MEATWNVEPELAEVVTEALESEQASLALLDVLDMATISSKGLLYVLWAVVNEGHPYDTLAPGVARRAGADALMLAVEEGWATHSQEVAQVLGSLASTSGWLRRFLSGGQREALTARVAAAVPIGARTDWDALRTKTLLAKVLADLSSATTWGTWARLADLVNEGHARQHDPRDLEALFDETRASFQKEEEPFPQPLVSMFNDVFAEPLTVGDVTLTAQAADGRLTFKTTSSNGEFLGGSELAALCPKGVDATAERWWAWCQASRECLEERMGDWACHEHWDVVESVRPELVALALPSVEAFKAVIADGLARSQWLGASIVEALQERHAWPTLDEAAAAAVHMVWENEVEPEDAVAALESLADRGAVEAAPYLLMALAANECFVVPETLQVFDYRGTNRAFDWEDLSYPNAVVSAMRPLLAQHFAAGSA